MKKLEVVSLLAMVKTAKEQHALEETKFNSDIVAVMTRLLHEAAVNYMSAEEVAKHSGFTVKRVRALMRDVGLNPRDGKGMLNRLASEALSNNAALMGIEPYEMDLMSPLAYLPMGEQMKRELADRTVSQVHEVSENLLTDDDWFEYQRLPEQGYSHRMWLEKRFALRLAERDGL